MIVNYININKRYKSIKINFLKKLNQLGNSGNFILGPNLKEFEKNISKYLNIKYSIGVANGSDALELAFQALNLKKNDEVLTTSNTFVSVINAIKKFSANVKFIDIDETLNINPEIIEKNISKKTKILVVTHLNGMPCCMSKILSISKKYSIKIVEDCSQAFGSEYDGKKVGTLGDIGIFSLHPTKNLGVFGDGGLITTSNLKIKNKIMILRNHGLQNRDDASDFGRNSRLDEMQAVIGLLMLKKIDKIINKRIRISKVYDKNLCPSVTTPKYGCCKNIKHTFHRYVIRVNLGIRDNLIKYLLKKKVDVKIHYKKNLHQMKVFQGKKFINLEKTENISKEMLSLPIDENLSYQQIGYVIKTVNSFFSQNRQG
jgi:dTDP-4-amino-4,6-dideoxygalactose transaminase